MNIPKIPRRAVWATAVLLATALLAVLTLVWMNRPCSKADARRATVLVVGTTHGELRLDGRPLIFFSTVTGDSLLTDATDTAALAVDTTYAMGCWTHHTALWPSCRGRAVTVDTLLGQRLPTDAQRVVACTRRLLEHRIATTLHDLSELRYYLRVHGVQDEGYHDIAQLTASRARQLSRDRRTLAVLDSIATLKGKLSLSRVTSYELRQQLADHSWTVHDCHVEAADTASQLVLLRLADGRTPQEAKPVVLPPWTAEAEGEALAVSLGGIGEGLPFNVQDTLVVVGGQLKGGAHDFPHVLVSDGAPVFSPSGRFIGMVHGRQIILRDAVRRLVRKGGEQ